MIVQSPSAHPYLQTASQAFAKAVHQSSHEIRQYSIAGRCVALHFAGSHLISDLTDAFAHLQEFADQPADLTICIWDSASTGVPLEAPPLGDALLPMGEIPGLNSEKLHAIYNITGQILYLLDVETRSAYFWIKDSGRLPKDIKGAPLRPILHWWLGHQHMQMLHAGMVGLSDGRGALIVGGGGSGKSTTVLTCLDNGMRYLSDDRVILDMAEDRAVGHGLYCSARLTETQLNTRFTHLQPLIVNPDRDPEAKALLLLCDGYADALIPELEIQVILLPHITGQPDTMVQRVSGAAALLKLAPGSMFPQRMPSEGELRALARLVKMVPTYQLNLGTDLDQIPQVIRRLL